MRLVFDTLDQLTVVLIEHLLGKYYVQTILQEYIKIENLLL